MADAIERLIELMEPMEIPWQLYYDAGASAGRYEVRVNGEGPYRVMALGQTAWEVAAKAVDQIEAAARV